MKRAFTQFGCRRLSIAILRQAMLDYADEQFRDEIEDFLYSYYGTMCFDLSGIEMDVYMSHLYRLEYESRTIVVNEFFKRMEEVSHES